MLQTSRLELNEDLLTHLFDCSTADKLTSIEIEEVSIILNFDVSNFLASSDWKRERTGIGRRKSSQKRAIWAALKQQFLRINTRDGLMEPPGEERQKKTEKALKSHENCNSI